MAAQEEADLRRRGASGLRATAALFELEWAGVAIVEGYALGLRLIAADLEDEAGAK